MKELVLRKGWDERLSVLAQFMILWVYNIILPLVLGFRLISKTHTHTKKGRNASFIASDGYKNALLNSRVRA